MYGHIVLPLFTKRWRSSGGRGSKIPWYCEDTGREMWSLILGVGDTPGVKNAKSKTTMASVLHLAMHEDPITENFYIFLSIISLYRGKFQWWKDVEYTGGTKQVFMPIPCRENNAADLSWAAHRMCLFLQGAVESSGSQHSSQQKNTDQLCPALPSFMTFRTCHKIVQSSGLPFNSWAWWQQMSLEKSTRAVMGDNFGKHSVGLCWLWLWEWMSLSCSVSCV